MWSVRDNALNKETPIAGNKRVENIKSKQTKRKLELSILFSDQIIVLVKATIEQKYRTNVNTYELKDKQVKYIKPGMAEALGKFNETTVST